MKIYATYVKGNQQRLIKKLNRNKQFLSVEKYDDYTLIIVTSKKISEKNKIIIKRMKEYFSDIKYVKYIKLYADVTKTRNAKKIQKILHLFFDIDSTLTHTKVKTIDSDVKSYFNKFKELNCILYFCTGRSYQEVMELNQKYDLGPYGIAEAGGIIVGIGRDGKYRFGKNNEPDKSIKYLNDNAIKYTIDPNQSNRLTEFVLLKESIQKNILTKAIKKSKSKVDCHMTKNTYHITSLHVNKGTAINHLIGADELDLNPESNYTIGIGDSELDIPMFDKCQDSYSVGTDIKVRKAAKHNLQKTAPRAIFELYNKLIPH